MRHSHILLIILYFFSTSCSSRDNKKLALALEKAKENTSELLKVIEHYKHDSDTLKYAAALFLIENMSYHYGGYSKNISLIELAKKEFVINGTVRSEILDSINRNVNFEQVADAECIKADFLIHNIDHAFDAWRKRPWGKYYSFSEFCEYLLPYRVDNEPLEDWREIYAERYGYLLDSVYTGSDIVEAATTICQRLREEGFHHTHIFNNITVCASPSFLLDYRTGGCTEESNFTIHVLRSLGIPVQNDFYAYSPETYSSHSWCVLLDTNKQNIPFCYMEYYPIRNEMRTDERKKCKIYRKTFQIQDDILASWTDVTIPPTLKKIFQKDVSNEYFQSRLSLPVRDINKRYYLGTFNKERIIPICKGEIHEDSVSFGAVEDRNIYLLLSGISEKLELESEPFVFIDGQLHYLKADLSKIKAETLYRKFPLFRWNQERMYRIIKAQFYGGNHRNRINKKLYEVCDTPYVCFNTYPMDTLYQKNRYLKYIARNDVLLELAELHFFNDREELIPQNIISGESYNNKDPEMQLKNCFDNDPLTYFLSKNKGDSIIFDFGKEVNITYAICVPRNDDNFIRIGDEYELFYFDKRKGWISLLRKVANKNTIECKVPDNALLMLRDWTRGKEEQVFFFSNHKQMYICNI